MFRKFQALKLRLKIWNAEEFGDLNKKLEDSEKQLHQLEMLQETRALNREELISKNNMRSSIG